MRKIVVDTNILVRLFARDDGAQWEIVQKLFAHGGWVILPTVVLETEWVLRSKFRLSRDHIIQLFGDLLSAEDIDVIDRPAVAAAVDSYKAGMDFADALHLAALQPGSTFVTFDVDLLKRAKQQFSHLTIELAQ